MITFQYGSFLRYHVNYTDYERLYGLTILTNNYQTELFSGYSLDSKDELVDALSTLKKRAAEDDANILFSVASDLSKVMVASVKFRRRVQQINSTSFFRNNVLFLSRSIRFS